MTETLIKTIKPPIVYHKTIKKIVKSALDNNLLYTDLDNTERPLNRMLNVIDFENKSNQIVTVYADSLTYIRHDKLEQIPELKDMVRALLEKEQGYMPKTAYYCIGI